MSDPNCTQCREWEICPFHAPEDADASAETERSVEAQSTPEPFKYAEIVAQLDLAWRLLGPDDPEVSSDLIYATPDGGVVAVPRP